MKIRIWGCRGSLPSPGPENFRFGGHTSCVQVIQDDQMLILDGGSGLQKLGTGLPPGVNDINILITHLHLDHLMGLGFFNALYSPYCRVKIWGPTGTGDSLEKRLRRYFSPPLFPVRLQDLPTQPEILELNESEFEIGPFRIHTEYICHPGPTVGYRIEAGGSVLTYLPDHEPALGASNFPENPLWTSGFNLAHNCDLLLHDAQYSDAEYKNCVGWGHSSIRQAIQFAGMTNAKKVLLFHHDPTHSDEVIEKNYLEVVEHWADAPVSELAMEGAEYEI